MYKVIFPLFMKELCFSFQLGLESAINELVSCPKICVLSTMPLPKQLAYLTLTATT